MRVVRAHKFGGPEVIQIDEVADPIPGQGEVVIDIKAAGVNPADTYMLGGAYAIKPDLPYTLGADAGGVISAVGPGANKFEVGDNVYVGICLGFNPQGCYADKLLRVQEDVASLPDNISFEQGASLGTAYATAHYGLFARGGATAGETVFIHGASGAVGTAAIQLAKRAGLTVIGSAGTDGGCELVKAEGADHVVDHTKTDYMETVREASGGNGPELILEMLANLNLAADLDVVGKYGRIVVIGNRGEITVNPRVAMMKELDVRGIALFNASREQMEQIVIDLDVGLRDGSLVPVVGKRMPLTEAAASHTAVLERGAHGKIVLIP
jgi:NADPH:quinone reductase